MVKLAVPLDPPPTTAAAATPPRHPRRRRIAILVTAAVVLPIAVKEGDVLFGQNFHTVEPGAVYRSGQLSGTALEERARKRGIKSVLNLRGPNVGSPWYDEELKTCTRNGLEHFDLALSARELPRPAMLAELVRVLRDAPRPLLIHCKNGADRSGLASAVALVLDQGTPPSAAASAQLSLWYGHVPVGATTAMDRVFDLFGEGGGGKGFAAWVLEDYPAAYLRERGGHEP